jgi:hypothetical protein
MLRLRNNQDSTFQNSAPTQPLRGKSGGWEFLERRDQIMVNKKRISRRQFLTGTAGAALGAISFPYVVSSSALGQAGNVTPSERITMGLIGMGWQGGGNLKSFLAEKDCQVVAVCDIDKNHLNDAVNQVNEHYQNKDCAAYNNFR